MIKAVIFDVDGVLLDSLHSNAHFLQKLLDSFGYPGMTVEKYSKMYFLSMWDVIRTFTGLTDEKKIQEIWEAGKTFEDGGEPPTMPDKAEEVLRKLHKKYKLGLVTSRVKDHIFEGELKALQHLFTVAIGYENTKKHKPDPEPLLLAAEKMGLKPSECVYIGDMPTDMQAGKAAGMKTIFYTPNSFPEIPAQIEKLTN